MDSGQSSVDSGQDLPLKAESESPASEVQRPASKLKPAFKPSFKAKAKDESPASDVQRLASEKSLASDVQRLASNAKPAFKPSFKPKAVVSDQLSVVSDQLSVDSGQDLPSKAEFESPASEVQRLASVKSLATEKSPASNIDNPEEK